MFAHLADTFIQSNLRFKEDRIKQLWVKGIVQDPNSGTLAMLFEILVFQSVAL